MLESTALYDDTMPRGCQVFRRRDVGLEGIRWEDGQRTLNVCFTPSALFRFQVLATNHVFDILLRAMADEGKVGQVEEKALPPRKRAGWVGGDDRGPSSMPVARQPDSQSPGNPNETPPKANRNGLEEGGGEAAAGEANRRSSNAEECGEATGVASSSAADDHVPSDAPITLKGFNKEDSEATKPDRNSTGESATMELGGRGAVGERGVKREGEKEVVKADGEIEGERDEAAAGKRDVKEDGDEGSSPGAGAKRIKTDSGDVA